MDHAGSNPVASAMIGMLTIKACQDEVAKGIIVGSPEILLDLEITLNQAIPELRFWVEQIDLNHPLADVASRIWAS